MSIQTNTNARRLGKGISTVKYPGENVTQRFVAKDYVGEQSIDNETGLWKFSPQLSTDSIYGLEDALSNLEADYDYITVNGYRDSDDIVPEPLPDADIIIDSTQLQTLEGLMQDNVFVDNVLTFTQQPIATVYITATSNREDLISIGSGTGTGDTMEVTNVTWSSGNTRFTYRSIGKVESDTDITISFTVTSDDTRYDSYIIPDVTLTMLDNTANVNITQFHQTVETSNVSSILRLASQPESDVVITFNPDSPTDVVQLEQYSYTFTPANWNVVQTLTYLVGEHGEDTEQEYIKGWSITTDDPFYSLINTPNVTIRVLPKPEVAPEVRIGNVIWKTTNESWTDGGTGIYDPNLDSANASKYGRLYDDEAIPRLLAANPGYRLPTTADMLDLRLTLANGGSLSGTPFSYIFKAETVTSNEAGIWEQAPNPGWSNANILTLLPAGQILSYLDPVQAGQFGRGCKLWYNNTSDGGYGTWRVTVTDNSTLTGYINISSASTYNYAYSVRLVKDI